jgi:SAM-dependent methyltransferase
MERKLRLNVACGMQKITSTDEWETVNIDSNRNCQPDLVCDVLQGLPYKNDSADEIVAEHFIEHLDGHEFIRFFNDCHRVLKTGGVLKIKAPHRQGKWAWIDPTHKRFLDEYSFDFFINRDYNSESAGVTGWYEPLHLSVVNYELQVVLRKKT